MQQKMMFEKINTILRSKILKIKYLTTDTNLATNTTLNAKIDEVTKVLLIK